MIKNLSFLLARKISLCVLQLISQPVDPIPKDTKQKISGIQPAITFLNNFFPWNKYSSRYNKKMTIFTCDLENVVHANFEDHTHNDEIGMRL